MLQSLHTATAGHSQMPAYITTPQNVMRSAQIPKNGPTTLKMSQGDNNEKSQSNPFSGVLDVFANMDD
eukprot:7728743-Ditylum_brightwellii.AAC.1